MIDKTPHVQGAEALTPNLAAQPQDLGARDKGTFRKDSLIDLPAAAASLDGAAALVSEVASKPAFHALISQYFLAKACDARPAKADNWKRELAQSSQPLACACVKLIPDLAWDEAFLAPLKKAISAQHFGGEAITLRSVLRDSASVRMALWGLLEANTSLRGAALDRETGQLARGLAEALRVSCILELKGGLSCKSVSNALLRTARPTWLEAGKTWEFRQLASQVPLEDVSAVIQKVDALHALKIDPTQKQFAARFRSRLQRNVALQALQLMITAPDAEAGRSLVSRFTGVVAEVLGGQDNFVHPFHADNERAIFARVAEALQRGSVTLCCMSCPNYSGKEVLQAGGQRQWVFDFQSLGSEIGVVAQRGIPWVSAWAEAFNRQGVAVSIFHLEPDFEIVEGFSGQKGVKLTREEAQALLRASNEKIKEIFVRSGFSCQTALWSEFVPEGEMNDLIDNYQRRFSQELAAGTNEQFLKYVKAIFRQRSELYKNWYPARAGEGVDEYSVRIINTVILRELAQHAAVADCLTKAQSSLLLAYDSAGLSEISAVLQMPLAFGFGTAALGYSGD